MREDIQNSKSRHKHKRSAYERPNTNGKGFVTRHTLVETSVDDGKPYLKI
jgi:hypothetical protein